MVGGQEDIGYQPGLPCMHPRVHHGHPSEDARDWGEMCQPLRAPGLLHATLLVSSMSVVLSRSAGGQTSHLCAMDRLSLSRSHLSVLPGCHIKSLFRKQGCSEKGQSYLLPKKAL